LERVVTHQRLSSIAVLPRGPHLVVGTPKSDVVRALPRLLRTVRVDLTEPDPVTQSGRSSRSSTTSSPRTD
ncbi:MAG: hypothetical protein M3Y40_10615, partial [Chloroflexota bacterium]|nr:hypothetical protein [Chloroflexota bacterium]